MEFNVIIQGGVDKNLFLERNVVIWLHFERLQRSEDEREVLFSGAGDLFVEGEEVSQDVVADEVHEVELERAAHLVDVFELFLYFDLDVKGNVQRV